MRMTTKTTYGLRAVAELAMKYNKGPVSVSEISRKEGISVSYLEQLLNKMKRRGVVKSIRGARGGYVLARHPKKIKINEIVKILEGDISIVFCVTNNSEKKDCERLKRCVTRPLWKRVNESINSVLEATSLEDLCKGKRV